VVSKISSVDLFLNTRFTFPKVMIKEKTEIILYPSVDECLSQGQYFNVPNI